MIAVLIDLYWHVKHIFLELNKKWNIFPNSDTILMKS